MQLDLQTGRFLGQEPQSVRRLREIAEIFATPPLIEDDSIVYETYGCPADVEGDAQMLYATTVLYPGLVGDEYFMTRGHFHERQDRGEFMLTLAGEGALILMDRAGNTILEALSPGTTVHIEGTHAHRVANTGTEPLVFIVTWMSDCGHDYESIRKHGFSRRLMKREIGPELIPAENLG